MPNKKSVNVKTKKSSENKTFNKKTKTIQKKKLNNISKKKTKITQKKKLNNISKKKTLKHNIIHLESEVNSLGRKFEKTADRKCERTECWFNKNLGWAGPLISGIFGWLFFVFGVWVLRFMNFYIKNNILSGIHLFFLANLGLFFLIFLFFSYTSYFSRNCKKAYLLFSPILNALGFIIGVWVVLRIIGIIGIYENISTIYTIAFYMEKNLFWIFWFVILFGYFILLVNILSKESIKNTKKNIMVKKTSKTKTSKKEIKRIYRSGEERILGGVCGGIAEHLNVDPVLIRLLWVLGSLAWGAGIFLYIIAWVIIPRNPEHEWED